MSLQDNDWLLPPGAGSAAGRSLQHQVRPPGGLGGAASGGGEMRGVPGQHVGDDRDHPVR